MFEQLVFNGLIMGGLYALTGFGFALIYNTTGIFHISYAPLYMLGPYMVITYRGLVESFVNFRLESKIIVLALMFFTSMTMIFLKKKWISKESTNALFWLKASLLNLLAVSLLYCVLLFSEEILIVIMACLTVSMLSVLIEILVYRKLEKKKVSSNAIMVASIGIMIVLTNLTSMYYGSETRVINPNAIASYKVLGITVTYVQLLILGISSSMLLLFIAILKFSRWGIESRALRDDTLLFRVLGGNKNKLRIVLFAVSGFCVAMAGCLKSLEQPVTPYIGMPILLSSVVALIIGGMGRFEAPVIGGYLIGLMQAVVVFKFSDNWKEMVTFSLLILFLLFRPHGILGEKRREI